MRGSGNKCFATVMLMLYLAATSVTSIGHNDGESDESIDSANEFQDPDGHPDQHRNTIPICANTSHPAPTSERFRTPEAIPDNIFDEFKDHVSGRIVCKSSKTWHKTYYRARRWQDQLEVKKIRNPLTVTEEERVVFKAKGGKELVVPKTSEKKAIVEGYRELSKNDGAKKLFHRIRRRWCGISKRYIQGVINKNQEVQQNRPTFDNKAPLKPVEASKVMERNQVDLVTFLNIADTVNGVTYKHVMSVMDVFSRYVFLRPLPSKDDEAVAAELEKLYDEIGPPKIFQTDQGGEFKGTVAKLMASMNVKMIRSSPYHPQSQGKIEHSHSTWKHKLREDILKAATDDKGRQLQGFHWTKALPQYARLYNEGAHSSLGFLSPFTVFYGRESNRIGHELSLLGDPLKKEDVQVEETTHDVEEVWKVAESNVSSTKDSMDAIRKKALTQSKITATRMVNKNKSKTITSQYYVKDRVWLKPTAKRVIRGGRPIHQPLADLATVVDTNWELRKYKVEYVEFGSGRLTQKWVTVDRLASLTREEDRQRRQKVGSLKKGVAKKKKKNRVYL